MTIFASNLNVSLSNYNFLLNCYLDPSQRYRNHFAISQASDENPKPHEKQVCRQVKQSLKKISYVSLHLWMFWLSKGTFKGWGGSRQRRQTTYVVGYGSTKVSHNIIGIFFNNIFPRQKPWKSTLHFYKMQKGHGVSIKFIWMDPNTVYVLASYWILYGLRKF